MPCPVSNTSQTTVNLDGVICLSAVTSKACFWDNQMAGSGFSFPAGTHIPIGVPDTTIDPEPPAIRLVDLSCWVAAAACARTAMRERIRILLTPRPILAVESYGSRFARSRPPTFAPNRYDPLVACGMASE